MVTLDSEGRASVLVTGIDIEMLRAQKVDLVNIIVLLANSSVPTSSVDSLHGILNLLDAITDKYDDHITAPVVNDISAMIDIQSYHVSDYSIPQIATKPAEQADKEPSKQEGK